MQDLHDVQDGHPAQLRPHAVLEALCPLHQGVPLLQGACDSAPDHVFVVSALASAFGGEVCSTHPNLCRRVDLCVVHGGLPRPSC
jgi:hypothetical protein